MGSVSQNWKSRPERHLGSHPAQLLREEGGIPTQVFVTNLSGEGLRLTGCSLDIGDICELLVPGNGMFRIEVRWTAGDRCGAKFLD